MYDHIAVRNLRLLGILVIALLVLIGCQPAFRGSSPAEGALLVPPTPVAAGANQTITQTQSAGTTPVVVKKPSAEAALYQDPSQPVEAKKRSGR
jgi:hypothetical protein